MRGKDSNMRIVCIFGVIVLVCPSDEADLSVLASSSPVEFHVYRCACFSSPPASTTTSGTTHLALRGLSELQEHTPIFKDGQTNTSR